MDVFGLVPVLVAVYAVGWIAVWGYDFLMGRRRRRKEKAAADRSRADRLAAITEKAAERIQRERDYPTYGTSLWPWPADSSALLRQVAPESTWSEGWRRDHYCTDYLDSVERFGCIEPQHPLHREYWDTQLFPDAYAKDLELCRHVDELFAMDALHWLHAPSQEEAQRGYDEMVEHWLDKFFDASERLPKPYRLTPGYGLGRIMRNEKAA